MPTFFYLQFLVIALWILFPGSALQGAGALLRWQLIGSRQVDLDRAEQPFHQPVNFLFSPRQRGFYGVLVKGPFPADIFTDRALEVECDRSHHFVLSVEDDSGAEFVQFLKVEPGTPAWFSLNPADFRPREPKRRGKGFRWSGARGFALASYDGFHRTGKEIFQARAEVVVKKFRRPAGEGELPGKTLKTFDLYLLNTRDHGVKQLTHTPDRSEIYPHPNRDGTKVTFTLLSSDRDSDSCLLMESRDEETARIAVMDLPVGTVRVLPTPDGSLYSSFLPDGEKILYSAPGKNHKQRDIWVHDLARGTNLNISRTGETEIHPYYENEILLYVVPTRSRVDLRANRLDFSAPRALFTVEPRTFLRCPRISFDGALIAYCQRDSLDNRPPPGDWDLQLLDLKNSRLINLSSGREADLYPAFFPDGQTLVFARTLVERDTTGIYQVHRENFGVKKIVEMPSISFTMPQFLNEDGDLIAAGWRR